MKLNDYRETYYEFSGKASDVARQLAFAGIAIIWLFKIRQSGIPKIPNELILPAITLSFTLAFDLLQYVAGTFVWGVFQWYKERQLEDLSQDPEIESSTKLKWPQFVFFILKLISLIFSYCLIIKYLINISYISHYKKQIFEVCGGEQPRGL